MAKRQAALCPGGCPQQRPVVIAQALQVLDDGDWKALNSAFSVQGNPLTGKYPREPLYDRLFTRITMHAPAPIGLGPSSN